MQHFSDAKVETAYLLLFSFSGISKNCFCYHGWYSCFNSATRSLDTGHSASSGGQEGRGLADLRLLSVACSGEPSLVIRDRKVSLKNVCHGDTEGDLAGSDEGACTMLRISHVDLDSSPRERLEPLEVW